MTDTDDSALFTSADDDHVVDPDEGNPLETLVGEDKKFKSVEDLAKGKIESDRFIAQLTKELQELRRDLGTRITLEEFLDKQKASKEPVTPTPGANADGNQGSKVNPEDIQRLIAETLTKEQNKVLAKQNLAVVKSNLEAAWGTGYARVLKQKAAELEVGEQFLEGLAAQNPKAFFKLIGVDTGTPRDTYTPPPASSMHVRAPASGNSRRTFSDYQKLHTENPREYWSPRVQNEMHTRAATDPKFREELQASYNKQRS